MANPLIIWHGGCPMREMTRRFPLSAPQPWRKVLRGLLFGLHRPDGTRYFTRRQWLAYLWRAHWRKWLWGPVRCKFGTHRVGPGSDTGMGG